jgi:hypothetical protein
MSFHRTPTGHVAFIAKWGHGQGSPINPRRPATITTNDGDGHYAGWRYVGNQLDALTTLARRERRLSSGSGCVAVRYNNGYVLESAPDDFWIEEDGEFRPNIAAYPNIIAW